MYTADFVQVNHISHHPLEVPISYRYRRTLMYTSNNMVACTPLNLDTPHQPETSHLIWEFANFQNIIFSINFFSGQLPTRYRFYWLQSRNPIILKNICAMHRQQKFTFAASLARFNWNYFCLTVNSCKNLTYWKKQHWSKSKGPRDMLHWIINCSWLIRNGNSSFLTYKLA